MAKTVVINSGAIVAAVRRRDQHHAWARAHFEAETEPFTTCEAVISESFFLLERARGGKEALCGLLERAIIGVDFSFTDHPVLRKRRFAFGLEMNGSALIRFSDAAFARPFPLERQKRAVR